MTCCFHPLWDVVCFQGGKGPRYHFICVVLEMTFVAPKAENVSPDINGR